MIVASLAIHIAGADAAGPRRHFEIEAGDATVMLNEFAHQSDLQVMFDYNILRGMKTRPVSGDLEPSSALKAMLKGTDLMFDYVNDRTLAVVPKQPSVLARIWRRMKSRPQAAQDDTQLEQVLISGATDGGTHPLLGAQTIKLDRIDIDQSTASTVQDLLRTLPEVFGGGPNPDTVLGREAQSNLARGSGVNLRGLDAGATLILIDGRRLAPSGTAGAFEDVSNIPLSIIDHVDVLPDGASAKYGGDAVGGVVNFVTRRNFNGTFSQARDGSVTQGQMGERQFSQLFGNTRDSGSDLFSFEYFERDALQSHDRWQYTNNLTPYGGSNFDQPYGYPGTITDGTHFWPLTKGLTGVPGNLQQGAPNLYDQYLNTDVTPNEQRWSVFGKENLKITSDLALFAQGLFTQRKVDLLQSNTLPLYVQVPATNPFLPDLAGATGPLTVMTGTATYFGQPNSEDRIDTGNFSLGLTTATHAGWSATGYLGYAFEWQRAVGRGLYDPLALSTALADPSPATAFNPFVDASNNNPATLGAIEASDFSHVESTLKTASLGVAGPLGALPGGEIQASLGAEYRLQGITVTHVQGSTIDDSGSLGRRIGSAFGELVVPIIGENNELGIARRLELSMGARFEHYSDVGSATSPRLGLRWSLDRNLSFRSTWAKSFRPPNLTDMVAKSSQSGILTLQDPYSPTGSSTVLAMFGTNTGLQPETARSSTFGVDLTPAFLHSAALSLTYFNVSYAGRITDAQFGPNVLGLSNFNWLVTRNVTSAQLAAACGQTVFLGVPGNCASSGVTVIVDNRLRNIALLKTSGVDVLGKYSFQGGFGKFDLGLNATYLFNYSQANTPESPLLNIVSTQNNPINLKARAMAIWSHRGLALSSFVNFQNSYRDTLSVPNRGVSSWTTVDMQISYETSGDTPGWLDHTQFVMNAQNLFNVSAPFLNNPLGVGYDQENADLYGRFLSFEVRKRW